jgi:peptidoglycan/LPS O-acetylase OafA/YrhL
MLAAVVCAVLVLAYVGERLVERPGNEFGRRLSVRVRSRAAAVARTA